MLFEDGGSVVVQPSTLGGFMAIVPTQKLDTLLSQLESTDIKYEMEENFMNIDDMNEDMTTATVMSFGPDVDVVQLQSILDHID
ncbi:MAG: hypothetical protein SFU56_02380 [Capsulimonadales bacterium]|nr:hypothetical protein [Capsulimonadales bacterium]